MKLNTDTDERVYASSLLPDGKSGYSGTKASSHIKINATDITRGPNGYNLSKSAAAQRYRLRNKMSHELDQNKQLNCPQNLNLSQIMQERLQATADFLEPGHFETDWNKVNDVVA